MIIDATNLLLGRFATVAAKKALLGEEIIVINCEKAVMSGRRKQIIQKHKDRAELGQFRKGPFFKRRPDMYVKRVLRGMIPYKQEKGRIAYKKIRCYIGVPEEVNGKKIETVPSANADKLKVLRSMTVADICKQIGGDKWQNL